VHSLVDFNLQIPANAALFYVLCTVAAMESRFGKSRRKPVRRFSVMGEISNPDGLSESGLSEDRPSKDSSGRKSIGTAGTILTAQSTLKMSLRQTRSGGILKSTKNCHFESAELSHEE